MFSFFRRKKADGSATEESITQAHSAPPASAPAAFAIRELERHAQAAASASGDKPAVQDPAALPASKGLLWRLRGGTSATAAAPTETPFPDAAGTGAVPAPASEQASVPKQEQRTASPLIANKAAPALADAPKDLELAPPSATATAARAGWMERLKSGLKRTGSSLTTVFTGTQIDDALYEDLETALLMADAGVSATEFLLADLKRRVKEARATEPAQVKAMLQDAIAELLAPLEKTLVVGLYHPTVIMVAGVNGAGKTTSIGKLTKHFVDAGASVLLAAADTFRAAAREQLAVWADRNQVEIISQQGADPSAVAFDAVGAGRARGKDVVLIDTAGRLPTQKHLMEELTKIRRVVTKADVTAPHEVLLVIDGNTGQNALAQVKAFDQASPLTGLVVTKLDGTAKGGVLCAIAREKPVPVYFVGVGERLEDLQPFTAREFAQALVA